MSEHRAGVHWARSSADFTYESYNRAHEIVFKDGTIRLPASAAAEFRGDADRVDPEEAFVASLASCHMLTFLAICARKRLIVEHYDDEAVGALEKAKTGKLWVARVTLRPRVVFAGDPSPEAGLLSELHRLAHQECFIANSVKTVTTIEPRIW